VWIPKFEGWGCGNVLSVEKYGTLQGALTDECRSVAKWLLAGKNWRNSEKYTYVFRCSFLETKVVLNYRGMNPSLCCEETVSGRKSHDTAPTCFNTSLT
jgi:hypothetical protein